MAFQQQFINKQFNSPINLYSQQNIQEVLDRDKQLLSNGGVGINFYNPTVGKPNNLQNSAVLRMLEEEERSGLSRGKENEPFRTRTNLKWPPCDRNRQRRQRSTFKRLPGVKKVAWPPSENDKVEGDSGQSPEGGSQPGSYSVSNNRPAAFSNRAPLKPLTISCNLNSPTATPCSPILNQSPSAYNPNNPTKRWAPIHSPKTPPASSYIPQTPPVQSFPQSYPPLKVQLLPTQVDTAKLDSGFSEITNRPVTASGQVAHHQQQLLLANKRLATPPPSTITLRPQAPVSQPSPPVFSSQPATATLKGGKHLRGDLKWPPEPVKKQAEEENRQRLELAKGPACRPRKVRKDYTTFFAQHALNSSYPGYKAPPGTQYYGVSDY